MSLSSPGGWEEQSMPLVAAERKCSTTESAQPGLGCRCGRDPRRAVGRVEVAVVTAVIERFVTKRRRLDRAYRHERLPAVDRFPRRTRRHEIGTTQAVRRVLRSCATVVAHGEARSRVEYRRAERLRTARACRRAL